MNSKTLINFEFTDVDENTVIDVLRQLPLKSSFGFDGISSHLLHNIELYLVKPLTLLAKQTLNSGIFPDKLKIAKVIPIFKKGDSTQFTNYRPISLLPVISKVLEKIIYKQLYCFFKEHDLLYESQYGFRTEHSTELAAMELINRLILTMDNNETPLNIYLDMSKAFDTIDHTILINKLTFYGIHGVALDLIKSYLNNRYQFVEYDGVQSSMLPISTGVPQGSILGPLLFIIYINDFPNASRLFNFIMYADDTTLSCTIPRSVNPIENFEFECRLNKELCGIDEWLKVNKLSLNVNKSKYMLFNAGNKTLYPFEIKIDYISIERVYVFNFLGLIMDEHLNWKSHVEKISNKCSKTIGVLNKLKYFLPLTVKLILYNSLILPHLNYGIMTWGYKCDRINKLQKKAIRIVSLSKYNAHTEPIFKRLHLLKVADILKIQELKFYYRFMHNTLPRYLQRIAFHQNSTIHDHNTRRQNKLHITRTNHEYAKRCIRHNIPRTINNTTALIINKIDTHCQTGFVTYAKMHYIRLYIEHCEITNCYICRAEL